MAEHTPGPWHIWNNGIYGERDGLRVPVVTDLRGRITSGNVRLIIAAPDLLAALEALLIAERNDPPLPADGDAYYERLGSALMQADAAIAKARGQQ